MKLFLPPSKYSAHRVACIALYRALLEQCPRVQHLAEGWPASPLTFKHLIRKQFKRNQYVQSSRLVVAALKAGYEAEEMLRHAGDGDVTAKEKVAAVLLEVERTRILSRTNAAVRPMDPTKKRRLPAPYPGVKPILESRPRPREELGGSGIRKAPVFVNAGGLPLLRFSKERSPFLQRVLHQKQTKMIVLFERTKLEDEKLKMGKHEDSWDKLIEGLARDEDVEVGEKGEPWTHEMKEQAKRDAGILNDTYKKNRELTKKMLDIVSQEESLVARERMARKRERRKERLEMQEGGS